VLYIKIILLSSFKRITDTKLSQAHFIGVSAKIDIDTL